MLPNKLIGIAMFPVELSGRMCVEEFTSAAIMVLLSGIALCVRGTLKQMKECCPELSAIARCCLQTVGKGAPASHSAPSTGKVQVGALGGSSQNQYSVSYNAL